MNRLSEQLDLEEKIEIIIARALTMSERLVLSKHGIKLEEHSDEIADARMERWCQTAARGDKIRFSRRLNWSGVSEKCARRILSDVEPAELQIQKPWVNTLRLVIETTKNWRSHQAEKTTSNEKYEALPFEELLWPITTCARRMLEKRWKNSANGRELGFHNLFTKDSVQDLEFALLRQLSFASNQVLATEFEKRQHFGEITLRQFGLIPSRPPSRIQYRKFVSDHLHDGMVGLYFDFPVLARLISDCVNSWVDFIDEFVGRLANDRASFVDAFDEPFDTSGFARIVNINTGISDPHNGGRTVLKLHFENGFKIVYKPKDVGFEVAWGGLINWINANGSLLPLRQTSVIQRDSYGWVECIKPAPCESSEEVGQFYQRAGMLLFNLYLFGATDCHVENLIASRGNPCLIDLETILHPTAVPIADEKGEIDSVLRTGLLPHWSSDGASRFLIDISGLGHEYARSSRKRIWNCINTDEMHQTWEIAAGFSDHAPTIRGIQQDPNDYLDDLLVGFSDMYRLILRWRRSMSSNDLPLSGFANQKGRLIFRATKIYFEILNRSLSAHNLRNGAERSIELEQQAFAFLTANEKPAAWPILNAEIASLENLDIPVFNYDSSKEYLVVGGSYVSNYLRASGFKQMELRLKGLSESDLALQRELILGTFIARTEGGHAKDTRSAPDAVISLSVAGKQIPSRFVDAARLIGEQIIRRAIPASTNHKGWLGLTYIRNTEQFQVNLLAANLYDGYCGVAVFLSALSMLDSDTRFSELAIDSISPVRREFVDGQDINVKRMIRRIGIGGAIGFGSILYTFVLISRFLNNKELLKEAEFGALLIDDQTIFSSTKFGVIDGVAGCLLSLLSLYAETSSAEVLSKAINCGEKLLDSQLRSGPYAGAFPTVDGGAPSSGFSHGASGIACSLVRLFDACGDIRYLSAANVAFSFERPIISDPVREPVEFAHEEGRLTSWCHGAPGMALARLDARHSLDNPQITSDIVNTLETTKRYGLGTLDSLCCGNFGRVETLILASSETNSAQNRTLAEGWGATILEESQNIGRYRLRSNTQDGKDFFNPTLFHGLAGAGYQLLRLTDPAAVPSLLLWR